MSNLLLNGEEYQEYGFESEAEFEKAVIENSKFYSERILFILMLKNEWEILIRIIREYQTDM
jgi:hypothetical protein